MFGCLRSQSFSRLAFLVACFTVFRALYFLAVCCHFAGSSFFMVSLSPCVLLFIWTFGRLLFSRFFRCFRFERVWLSGGALVWLSVVAMLSVFVVL